MTTVQAPELCGSDAAEAVMQFAENLTPDDHRMSGRWTNVTGGWFNILFQRKGSLRTSIGDHAKERIVEDVLAGLGPVAKELMLGVKDDTPDGAARAVLRLAQHLNCSRSLDAILTGKDSSVPAETLLEIQPAALNELPSNSDSLSEKTRTRGC